MADILADALMSASASAAARPPEQPVTARYAMWLHFRANGKPSAHRIAIRDGVRNELPM